MLNIYYRSVCYYNSTLSCLNPSNPICIPHETDINTRPLIYWGMLKVTDICVKSIMRLYGWRKRTETLFVLVNRRPEVQGPLTRNYTGLKCPSTVIAQRMSW